MCPLQVEGEAGVVLDADRRGPEAGRRMAALAAPLMWGVVVAALVGVGMAVFTTLLGERQGDGGLAQVEFGGQRRQAPAAGWAMAA